MPRPSHGPRKTLHNRFVRWAAKGAWQAAGEELAPAGGPPAEVLLDSTHVRAHRCATGGNGGSGSRRSASAADCRAAEALLQRLPADALIMADRAQDTDAVRERIQARGAVPNIP